MTRSFCLQPCSLFIVSNSFHTNKQPVQNSGVFSGPSHPAACFLKNIQLLHHDYDTQRYHTPTVQQSDGRFL